MREIVFCTTCRYSAAEKLGPEGLSGGEMLAREMTALVASRSDVSIGRQVCLWSCLRHCNVFLRDPERFSYLIGGFAPKTAAAEAILAWFDLHGMTATGEVPFRSWPDAMRGHFIARFPPERR